MDRHAKIICTLGPSSKTEAMISKMAKRGMNVARINSSHGTHRQHQKMVDLIRKVNVKYHYSVTILQDLEGYRIRIGHLDKLLHLTRDQVVYLSQTESAKEDHIPFDFQEDIKQIRKGLNVFIDDGKIHLKVLDHEGKKLKCKVIQDGVLKSRKGVNIPGFKLKAKTLTEKDREDLNFAIENKVEKIAQSFVRNKKDVYDLREIVDPHLPECKIIAKIENQDGVKNIDSIIEASDGIMIARGDLGVSIPIYKIPILQKHIIRRCIRKKKFVITATQMLDSMIENGRPTRAEVSDVANAILDGTDYVMLSGETAVGRFPSRSIKMMSQIIEYTEGYEEYNL